MNYFYIFINIMLDMMARKWFWIFIVGVAALGRYLLSTQEIEFARKTALNLTLAEKKRKQRLIFWGRSLIAVSLLFGAIFVMFCFIV